MIFHKEEYDRQRQEARYQLNAFGFGEIIRSFLGLGIVGALMLLSWLGDLSMHGVQYILGIPMLIMLVLQILILATKKSTLESLER